MVGGDVVADLKHCLRFNGIRQSFVTGNSLMFGPRRTSTAFASSGVSAPRSAKKRTISPLAILASVAFTLTFPSDRVPNTQVTNLSPEAR